MTVKHNKYHSLQPATLPILKVIWHFGAPHEQNEFEVSREFVLIAFMRPLNSFMRQGILMVKPAAANLYYVAKACKKATLRERGGQI